MFGECLHGNGLVARHQSARRRSIENQAAMFGTWLIRSLHKPQAKRRMLDLRSRSFGSE